jgi:hypothetical protein
VCTVRTALLIALLTACTFEPGSFISTDAEVDTQRPPDVIAPTWAVDAVSGKGVPASASDWTELFTTYGIAAAAPDHLWLLQETSGNAGDSIGSIALSPVNGPTYSSSVAGWSRRAVGTTEGNGDQSFYSSAVGDQNGTAYVVLAYVAVVSAPTQDRSLLGLGAATDHHWISITTAPALEAKSVGASGTSGTANPIGAVHPIVLRLHPTTSSYTVYTDVERLSATWTSTSGDGNLFVLGNAISGAATARYLYAAMWTGSAADISETKIKAMLQALGWSVTGY